MSIVDELKKLIIARGGSIVGVHTIMDAVRVLVELEEQNNENAESNEPSEPSEPSEP